MRRRAPTPASLPSGISSDQTSYVLTLPGGAGSRRVGYGGCFNVARRRQRSTTAIARRKAHRLKGATSAARRAGARREPLADVKDTV